MLLRPDEKEARHVKFNRFLPYETAENALVEAQDDDGLRGSLHTESSCQSRIFSRLGSALHRNLNHTVALSFEQLIGILDLRKRVSMRNERFGIEFARGNQA